jgi:hypothetical protein
VHVGDVSSNTGAGEPEYLGDAEVFGNLKELRITGPLTIVDQVAHELYPKATDAE